MSSVKISDERLKILHEQVAGVARQYKNDNDPVWVSLNAKEIAAILNEVRRRRNFGHGGTKRISHVTEALMALQIYESFETEPMAQSSLATLKRTARKKLDNELARWHSETMPSGLLKITRVPDGSPAMYNRERNPLIDILGRMHLNQVIVIKKKSDRTVSESLKQQTRRKYENPAMNWLCRSLNNGKIRVRRIR
jgi:hypothetical protein